MYTTMTQRHRLPVVQFQRFLHRSGVSMPGGLEALRAGRPIEDPYALAELTEIRAKGTAGPAEREGIAVPPTILDGALTVIREATLAVVSTRWEQGSRQPDGLSADAALVRGGEALVLSDEGPDVVVELVPTPSVSQVLAARLPQLSAARIHSFSVPQQVLDAVASARSLSDYGLRRATERAGIAPQAVEVLWRLRLGVRAQGAFFASPVGGAAHAGMVTDWFTCTAGSVLRYRNAHGHWTFEPCDRAAARRALTEAFNAALRG